MKKIISENLLSLIFFSFCSLLVIYLLPFIDKFLFPSSEMPGSLTVLGVGLAMTIFLTVVLYFGIKSSIGLVRKFWLFFVLYNALVIIVKFSLAPLSIYEANQNRMFETYTFGSSGVANPIFLFGMSAMVFLSYFIVFWLLYLYFDRSLKKELSPNTSQPTIVPRRHRVLKIVGFLLLLGVVVLAGGGIFLFPLFFTLFPMLEYLSYVFSTGISLFIALALTGAVFFVTAAFKSAKEQANVLRDAAILASFFWIGAAFIFIYHALWVVYMLLLTSLWPLRVVTPK